ncbi:MAG: class IV adenylate cyclase [Verrucomicrobiae bacterium]|nr:class IV adenylate cyclase [Verrucomicrobiae bacterium]
MKAEAEIEVKILEVDLAALHARLSALQAYQEFSGEMHAIFFDDVDGGIRATGAALRLRREGDQSVLAFKRRLRKDTVKVMDEKEVSICCFDTMRQILNGLGYVEIAETRKQREEFLLPETGAKIVIDDYHDALECVPPFVEIEAPTEEAVHAAALLLGFSPDQCLNWDTHDLACHYQVKM